MKKIWIVVLFYSFFSTLCFATTKIEDIIDSEIIETLYRDGSYTLIHPKNENYLTIVPDNPYKMMIEDGLIQKEKRQIPFVAEFLYLIPKTELLKDSKKKDVNIDDISVVIRSISKMKGMQFKFNDKKGTSKTLYSKTYLIESMNSEVAIPDQTSGSADGVVLYSYQDDHTFGDLFYELRYYQKPDCIYSTFTITDYLTYLGVKSIAPGNMRMHVLAIDCGDNILLYLMNDCAAKAVAMTNVRSIIQESMTDRMEAVYRWFIQQFK